MQKIEYKTVQWFISEPLQTQLDLLAKLGEEGWQVFHLHEMVFRATDDPSDRQPGIMIYASRPVPSPVEDAKASDLDLLRRKLVAAYVIGAQLAVNFRDLDESAEVIALGVHSCPSSPTGFCAYDDEGDPSHDECLFCHEPHERK